MNVRTLAQPRSLSLAAALIAGAALLAPSRAMADEPAAPPAPAPTGGGAAAGGSDHSQVVGTFGVGYMGLAGIPVGVGDYAASQLGNCGTAVGNQQDTPCRPSLTGRAQVPAPIIGARYWLSESMGIDVGLGLGFYSGSSKSFPYSNDPNSVDVEFQRDKVSLSAFALHAGVPLVLGTPGKHHTFQVVPELNIGFASGTAKDQVAPLPNPPAGQPAPTQRSAREDLKFGGFLLNVGARAGTEIHFGFIGLPKLSLQATVGLYFLTDSVKVSAGGKDATDSNTAIATSVQSAPWAIFTNNIAALYYF